MAMKQEVSWTKGIESFQAFPVPLFTQASLLLLHWSGQLFGSS